MTYSNIVGSVAVSAVAGVIGRVADDRSDWDASTFSAAYVAYLDAVRADSCPHAVSGRDDPVGVDNGAAAAEAAVAQPSCLPRPLVGICVWSSHDVRAWRLDCCRINYKN